MSNTETIFTKDEEVIPEVVDNTIQNTPLELQVPQELLELVGEGKKYATVNEALKSIVPAQAHISKIESDNEGFVAELAKRQTTEELIESIKSNAPTVPVTTETPSIDINALGSIVDQRLNALEATKNAAYNSGVIAEAFTAKYGDKAEETYNKVAKDSGLTVDALNKLTASSPNAVLKLAGLESPVDTIVTKTSSTINTENIQTNTTDILTSKLPKGASSKDVTKAWNTAGEIVKQRNSN